MAAGRLRLSVSARYRLMILSHAPQSYSARNHTVLALARKGLVEAVADEAKDRSRPWAITDAGREALQNYVEP